MGLASVLAAGVATGLAEDPVVVFASGLAGYMTRVVLRGSPRVLSWVLPWVLR